MATYDTAITCPRGASKPMPRESTAITISAMQIIEISDNINTFYNPMSYARRILTRQYMDWQGIYFLIFISFLMFLIFAGIFSLASDNQRFMRERNQRSYTKNKLTMPISGNT